MWSHRIVVDSESIHHCLCSFYVIESAHNFVSLSYRAMHLARLLGRIFNNLEFFN